MKSMQIDSLRGERGERRGGTRGCVVVFKGFEKRKRRYSICERDVGSDGIQIQL